jgi:hypothetical protein
MWNFYLIKAKHGQKSKEVQKVQTWPKSQKGKKGKKAKKAKRPKRPKRPNMTPKRQKISAAVVFALVMKHL